MITLITGRPGSGKTLLAVEMIRDKRERRADPAAVREHRWPGLRPSALFSTGGPDHLARSASRVHRGDRRMPKTYAPRASGARVPHHVQYLNEHRHAGIDLILMTPDPKLIDVLARKTVGRHLHAYRPFGMEHRTVFEWNSCNEDPEPSQGEKNALITKKPFDKTLYELYTSAEVHTHKSPATTEKICTAHRVAADGSFAVCLVVLVYLAAGAGRYPVRAGRHRHHRRAGGSVRRRLQCRAQPGRRRSRRRFSVPE